MALKTSKFGSILIQMCTSYFTHMSFVPTHFHKTLLEQDIQPYSDLGVKVTPSATNAFKTQMIEKKFRKPPTNPKPLWYLKDPHSILLSFYSRISVKKILKKQSEWG